MNKLIRKFACGALAAALGITAMTGCSDKKEEFDGTKTVVSNDGTSLSLATANLMLRYSQAQMQSYLGTGQQGLWEQYGPNVKDNAKNQIENMLSLRDHGEEYGVVVSDEEKDEIKQAAAAFMKENDKKVIETLGISQENVEEVLEFYTYETKMYDPMTADVDTNVTEEESAQTTVSYLKMSTAPTTDGDGNQVELTEEEKAEKKALVQKGLDQLKDSEDPVSVDMGDLAKSIDENMVGSASLSFTAAGEDSSIIDEAVRNSVAGLKDGAVVEEVVEGDDGYYAVRLDKAYDEEATAKEVETIINTRKSDTYTALLKQWNEEAGYTWDEELWDSLTLTDDHLYTFKVEETPETEAGAEE